MGTVACEVPDELREAFRTLLAGVPARRLAEATERLIASYRGTVATDQPLLRERADVIAYAAYRMPATYAAVRSALGAYAALAPRWSPRTHIDVGGGTGAAVWAAADLWRGPLDTTVLDWSEPALDLGRELALASPALAGRVTWRRQPLCDEPAVREAVPEADLLTCSYVLGELAEPNRAALLDALATRGRVVAVVEPGTPAGFARVREARDRLASAGLTLAAPCPHSAACPVVPGEDWCHFAARLGRSALHRQVKGGTLGYEDEKFSYVVASREPLTPAAGRVVRHPVLRKGMVQLQLCTAGGELARSVTTKKRHGDLYRAARDTAWGDAWPPAGQDPTGAAAPLDTAPLDTAEPPDTADTVEP